MERTATAVNPSGIWRLACLQTICVMDCAQVLAGIAAPLNMGPCRYLFKHGSYPSLKNSCARWTAWEIVLKRICSRCLAPLAQLVDRLEMKSVVELRSELLNLRAVSKFRTRIADAQLATGEMHERLVHSLDCVPAIVIAGLPFKISNLMTTALSTTMKKKS